MRSAERDKERMRYSKGVAMIHCHHPPGLCLPDEYLLACCNEGDGVLCVITLKAMAVEWAS